MKSYLVKYNCQIENFGAWFEKTMLVRAENKYEARKEFDKEIATREIAWANHIEITE